MLERAACNLGKSWREAIWPRGSPREERISRAPREARDPLCWNKHGSFHGSSVYTDVTIPLPSSPLSPTSPDTSQEPPPQQALGGATSEGLPVPGNFTPATGAVPTPGSLGHLTPKTRRMLRVSLLFSKATSNKSREPEGERSAGALTRCNNSCRGRRPRRSGLPPFPSGSVFSLCFSEQVGAMVIGAIEIDGAPRLVWGCRAVPMEMHRALGRARASAELALLHTAGPPRGPVTPANCSVRDKVPREAGPWRLLTFSL